MCISWTATGFVPSSRCILSPRFISSWRCWILVISHGRRCLSCRSLKRVHSKVWDLSSDFQFNLYALSTFQFNCITSTNTCWTRKWWKRKFALPINVQTCLPKPHLVMHFDVCEVRSADGKPLWGSVMNMLFMMEFINSREFPLSQFCLCEAGDETSNPE